MAKDKRPAQPPAPAQPIASPRPTRARFCPQCFRTGSDIGKCGRDIIPCPDPLPADPASTVTIECDTCTIRRTVPVGSIIRGEHLSDLKALCQHQDCQARIVTP